MMLSMSATVPLTTWWLPLSPEILSPTPPEDALASSTADATRSGGAKTAAMAPGSVSDMRVPRVAANRMPSSRLYTPAARAAASSPTLCPTTTSGRTPTLSQSAVSALSSA